MKIFILISFLLTLSQQSAFARPQDPLSDEYIEWIQSKATTWKAGRNFHKDTSMKFIKMLMGVLENPPKIDMDKYSYAKQVGPLPKNYVLPKNFDAREKWPNCPTIGEIRDQGYCGSCWAISSVEAMSDRTCSMSNGKINFHYSTLDVMSCCNSCGYGCTGGYPISVYYYWVHHGIVSGGLYNSSQGCSPYPVPACEHVVNGTNDKILPSCKDESNYYTPNCLKKCASSYTIQYADDLHRGKTAYGFDTLEEAQFDLVTNGPINAWFNVYKDFLTYKSGVYQQTDSSGEVLGGHAIKIIGYGVEDGVPYWLCANSWNNDWGDQGYFKIKRGDNNCEIEDDLLAGIPSF